MDLNAQIMLDLSSYLPPETQVKKGQEIPKENLDAEVKILPEEESVVSFQSTLAATRLLERSGQVTIAKRMTTFNEETQIARQLTKEKKQKDQKERKAAERAKEIPASKRLVMPADAKSEDVPLPKVMPMNQHIQNMEQHNRRAHEVELFASHVERPNQPTTAQIIATPDVTTTLSLARKVEQFKMCTDQYMEMLANNPHLKKQNIPVYTRQTLQPFLLAPNPARAWERPCCNLDRPPVHGEVVIQCIAHVLSGEMLGRDKAFKLRELLFPDQIVRINHCLEAERKDPRIHLLPVPQMCYLCHIYITNQMFLNERNKLDERERPDHTTPKEAPRTTMVTILNRFMVTFGTEGEYDVRRLIASDSISLGILGPFPLWSKRHYQPLLSQQGFAENEVMVFRLSQEPSQLIESGNQSGSIRSTPTTAKRGVINSRQ